jgi:hypothetical protein
MLGAELPVVDDFSAGFSAGLSAAVVPAALSAGFAAAPVVLAAVGFGAGVWASAAA